MSSAPYVPRSRASRKWLVRAVLGAAILLLILSRRQTALEVAAALRGVSPVVFVGGVAFYWLGQVLSAWKWQMLLSARGVKVPLWTCCRLYLAGMFGNLWLPTNIGGDALRASLLNRTVPTIGLADAAASIIVERLTGFAALLFLATLGLLWRGAGGQGSRILWSAALILFVLLVLWKSVARLAASQSGPLARKVASLRGALDFYVHPSRRAVLASALALSLLFQASQVFLNIALAHVTHLGLPNSTFWWLAPLLSLSGLVPAGIGGFGVREAAALAFLRRDFPTIAAGQIVAWSLLWQATVWLSSLPGALFLREKSVPLATERST